MFWLGGPDLAIEIMSPGEQIAEKIDLYSRFATRELEVIDRDPWALTLYRLHDGAFCIEGKATAEIIL